MSSLHYEWLVILGTTAAASTSSGQWPDVDSATSDPGRSPAPRSLEVWMEGSTPPQSLHSALHSAEWTPPLFTTVLFAAAGGGTSGPS